MPLIIVTVEVNFQNREKTAVTLDSEARNLLDIKSSIIRSLRDHDTTDILQSKYMTLQKTETKELITQETLQLHTLGEVLSPQLMLTIDRDRAARHASFLERYKTQISSLLFLLFAIGLLLARNYQSTQPPESGGSTWLVWAGDISFACLGAMCVSFAHGYIRDRIVV